MAYNWPIGGNKPGAPAPKAKRAAPQKIASPDGSAESGELQTGAPEPHHEAIHAGLSQMHEQTGNAHTHIEHHADGHVTSHHVSAEGEVSGPHDHADLDELKANFDKFMDEEGKEQDDDGEGSY